MNRLNKTLTTTNTLKIKNTIQIKSIGTITFK